MGLIKSVKNGIGAVVAGVNFFKQTKSEFERLREIVLTHNSKKDEELQKAQPLPAPSEPDYKQIKAYFSRGFALALELGQAIIKELKE